VVGHDGARNGWHPEASGVRGHLDDGHEALTVVIAGGEPGVAVHCNQSPAKEHQLTTSPRSSFELWSLLHAKPKIVE
jgi:hypothetical protein